ncbi:unnamed protein product [Calicophoron daubneyi]|uniref:EF-hand domain-containing protein n=1 Tax=Calicophoron daubneyi TaxID=300641 RepID=A0AAV2TS17_CALDB
MDDSELREVFQMIDRRGDERISKRDLKKFFKDHNVMYSRKELKSYMQRINTSNSGKITFAELKTALLSRNANPVGGGRQTYY